MDLPLVIWARNDRKRVPPPIGRWQNACLAFGVGRQESSARCKWARMEVFHTWRTTPTYGRPLSGFHFCLSLSVWHRSQPQVKRSWLLVETMRNTHLNWAIPSQKSLSFSSSRRPATFTLQGRSRSHEGQSCITRVGDGFIYGSAP